MKKISGKKKVLKIKSKKKTAIKKVMDRVASRAGKSVQSRSQKSGKAKPKADPQAAYAPQGSKQLIEGIYLPNPKGFGFVAVEGQEEDFFVPEGYNNGAFLNDRVLVEPVKKRSGGKRTEVRVKKILERGVSFVAGTYTENSGGGIVRPDNTRLRFEVLIPKKPDMKLEAGAKVVCEITDYPSRGPLMGAIVEYIGDANTPRADIITIAKSFGVPVEFPDEVINEAKKIQTRVYPRDIKGRRDYRGEMVVTIDGDDSKDFDDAVSLKMQGSDYLLSVHIADVAHYVTEGSAIDTEAVNRSVSVYLLDVVLPMLPESLSNKICSLMEGKDRLTLSVEMLFDKGGNLKHSSIDEGVIKSYRRLTYSQVNRILANPECEEASDRELTVMLHRMKKLAALLLKKRQKRGAIDFDFPEAKIVLDKKGRVQSVSASIRGESEHIIEEFMLVCNETVAKTCRAKGLPMLYRNHGYPEIFKIKELSTLVATFGFSLRVPGTKVRPGQLKRLIEETKGTEYEELIKTITLRSMQQAKYSSTDPFHFGLASECYLHFTSPIRRYPDLLVHRVIKEHLHGKLSKKRNDRYVNHLPYYADHTSKMERRAIECEREVNKAKCAEYMQDKIGEIFPGRISGVTGWGIFVALPNTVEGLVPIKNLLGDKYVYSERSHELIGKIKGKRFRLGDSVTIKVADVDMIQRTVEFDLEDES